MRVPVQRKESTSAVVVGLAQSGVQRQRFAEVGNGLGVPSQAVVGQAPVVVGRGLPGINVEDLREDSNSLLPPLLGYEGFALE